MLGFSFCSSPVNSSTVTPRACAILVNFSYGGELGRFAHFPIYPFEKSSCASSLVIEVFCSLHKSRTRSTNLALSTKNHHLFLHKDRR
nr:MAG TPA: hypothetical protein [Caudoviricetes sp.]